MFHSERIHGVEYYRERLYTDKVLFTVTMEHGEEVIFLFGQTIILISNNVWRGGLRAA